MHASTLILNQNWLSHTQNIVWFIRILHFYLQLITVNGSCDTVESEILWKIHVKFIME